MSSTLSIHRVQLLIASHGGLEPRERFRTTAPPPRIMTMDSKSSSARKMEQLSLQLPVFAVPENDDLRFDRLQPSEKDLREHKRLEFGQFVAREAMLDEEYWTSAWLRAESHWENKANDRFTENHKRKFAEQEFNAIKRRNRGQIGQQYTCIVAVKKETKNVKRTVLKSLVGTVDLSIRYLLHGETYPGERMKSRFFCSINRTPSNRYGYISNLCVSKSARRQGIASNMLQFALELAISDGVERVYVHVHRANTVAQDLYRKMGFEIVEIASSQLSEDKTYLLCCIS